MDCITSTLSTVDNISEEGFEAICKLAEQIYSRSATYIVLALIPILNGKSLLHRGGEQMGQAMHVCRDTQHRT